MDGGTGGWKAAGWRRDGWVGRQVGRWGKDGGVQRVLGHKEEAHTFSKTRTLTKTSG
jgi:hypothetical protein